MIELVESSELLEEATVTPKTTKTNLLTTRKSKMGFLAYGLATLALFGVVRREEIEKTVNKK